MPPSPIDAFHIGSGILVSPSLVFRHTGTIGVSLLVWLAAGAMALIHALCLSELGTLLPASGGEYAYLCAAADSLGRPGDFVAFMTMWGTILLADPMKAALQSLTFTSYALTPFYPTCQPPYEVTVLVAIAFARTNHMKAPFVSGDVTALGLTQAYFAATMSMGGA
ncbi:hypothetical protein HPB52_019566 [Rhipicephalus sanguineus]|uniref:Amino acid transporter n=1 Tax=Rhipicephalus sanguineus TaxID=34632 RepID=A0A9D4SQP2_RHISA|nr:hypothetical protein HPB52_019566 [Rhipicephalus sanguineus]